MKFVLKEILQLRPVLWIVTVIGVVLLLKTNVGNVTLNRKMTVFRTVMVIGVVLLIWIIAISV